MKKNSILVLFFAINLMAVEKGFVNLAEVDPTIILDSQYAQKHNFVGTVVEGYKSRKIFVSKPTADALVNVQKELKPFHLSLRIYDCYRPQKAVNHFVRWARDTKDLKTKKEFYPHVEKSLLFKEGYIAERSGHTRGSTCDLTIDGLNMGTSFDYLDPLANTENQKIPKAAMANRLLLRSVMEKHGFKNYEMEWWHYTLKNEPYPETYFDFDVE